MKQVNSVQLDGLVESCRIVGEVKGKQVAKLSVVTLHPNEAANNRSASLSSKYDKFRHIVRVTADGDSARSLQMLEKELKMEKASGQADLSSLHPCHVSGSLLSLEDGDILVDVVDKGFSLTDSVKTKDNNTVKITGSVQSFSYTDESARLQVNTPAGDITSFFLKSVNRNGWEAVSSGKYKKGDMITLSGPLVISEFTDGKKSMRTCMITPYSVQNHRIEKKVSSTQTL